MQTKVLFITPPFTQLNTPYPATAYLKGFLNTKNIDSTQMDLGMEVILKLFSKTGLTNLFEYVKTENITSKNAKRIYALKPNYVQNIDAVMSFLQGKNPSLALAICQEHLLPEASRFNLIEELDWAFGHMGIQDKAKHLATLFLEDLSDFIIECVDPYFGFSRYAERISSSAHTFDDLYAQLNESNSYINQLTYPLIESKIKTFQPQLLAISIPFPGNLFSGLSVAKFVKSQFPNIKITLGGGYVNTELRDITDPRLFEFIDFMTLDDGEAPIFQLIEHLENQTKKATLKRTFCLNEEEKIDYYNNPVIKDVPQTEVGVPDYSGLPLDRYISVIELVNPMHALWSNGRWNKLTLAHGCYWGKCTFCDISLDYIGRYEPSTAKLLCDRIEQMVKQTGETGFHFVDEAAPPALMRELALELLRRNLKINWWTNIRFEKSFTADLCQLLKASGCIAVSGGLEVASDRLLKLIEKGTDLKQVTESCQHFQEAGIMVHAYLMYGFPTQTEQETINSLEVVRQLFQEQLIQSGFWHQFAMTAHSPVGLNPDKYQVESILKENGSFANNDRPHIDLNGINHDQFSQGLKASIYNYMQGVGFDLPLSEWFDFPTKRPTISSHFILDILENNEVKPLKPHTKMVWLGTIPEIERYQVKKKGKIKTYAKMEFHSNTDFFVAKGSENDMEQLLQFLSLIKLKNTDLLTLKAIEETHQIAFNQILQASYFEDLKANGLLFL